jgi:hypothetical protein
VLCLIALRGAAGTQTLVAGSTLASIVQQVSSFIALTNGLLNRFDDAEIERPHARLDAVVTKPGNGAVSSLPIASGNPTDAADEAAEDPANAEADPPR